MRTRAEVDRVLALRAEGCISAGPRGVYRLRVNLDLAYPQIVDECEAAVRELVPHNRVYRLLRRNSYVDRPAPSHVELSAYSKSWPCLFPQHGPGKKHQRAVCDELGLRYTFAPNTVYFSRKGDVARLD